MVFITKRSNSTLCKSLRQAPGEHSLLLSKQRLVPKSFLKNKHSTEVLTLHILQKALQHALTQRPISHAAYLQTAACVLGPPESLLAVK